MRGVRRGERILHTGARPYVIDEFRHLCPPPTHPPTPLPPPLPFPQLLSGVSWGHLDEFERQLVARVALLEADEQREYMVRRGGRLGAWGEGGNTDDRRWLHRLGGRGNPDAGIMLFQHGIVTACRHGVEVCSVKLPPAPPPSAAVGPNAWHHQRRASPRRSGGGSCRCRGIL
jgi:hypothetical protein